MAKRDSALFHRHEIHDYIHIHIGRVKGPHKVDKCSYEQDDLLVIALLTYLTGRKDYTDMSLFAKHREREFGQLS